MSHLRWAGRYSRDIYKVSFRIYFSQHGEKMTREELQSILDDVDPEGTGKLDYAEVGVAELIFKR